MRSRPARESTATILALLIVGDPTACWHYRHDADWGLIRRLLPAVLPGLVVGALFLQAVDDTTLRRFVGTTAWFFLIVNLAKVPFSVGPGLMHPADAVRAASALAAGALLVG